MTEDDHLLENTFGSGKCFWDLENDRDIIYVWEMIIYQKYFPGKNEWKNSDLRWKIERGKYAFTLENEWGNNHLRWKMTGK